jgi:hypothetical protein
MPADPTPTNPATANTAATPTTFPYHYYLSVFEFSRGSIRTTEMELTRSHPIRTMDDVNDVKQWLRTEHGFTNPLISFSLLRNDLANRRGGQR